MCTRGSPFPTPCPAAALLSPPDLSQTSCRADEVGGARPGPAPPGPQSRPARALTFLVDLVVQCDRAAAPLDGPVRLLLRARVQGDALPLASDAAF